MAKTNDGFIFGLDEFNFKGNKFGYISEEGLTAAGDAPSTTDIRAAQAKNAVVKSLNTNPGSDKFNFTLIQLTGEGFKDVFGGEVDASGIYSAPAAKTVEEGPAVIRCSSGHVIDIPKASLTGNLAQAVNLAQTLAISCSLTILAPEDGSAPYKIYPPGTHPLTEG